MRFMSEKCWLPFIGDIGPMRGTPAQTAAAELAAMGLEAKICVEEGMQDAFLIEKAGDG